MNLERISSIEKKKKDKINYYRLWFEEQKAVHHPRNFFGNIDSDIEKMIRGKNNNIYGKIVSTYVPRGLYQTLVIGEEIAGKIRVFYSSTGDIAPPTATDF